MPLIRVLVVDDSALVRKILTEELSKCAGIEVVGSAIDPYVARDMILKLRPDVMTLDLEMPRMDGLSFLAKLMKHYPMPVVVVSSVAPENSSAALRALQLGAVEVVSKPGSTYSTPDVSKELSRAIKCAALSRPERLTAAATTASSKPVVLPPSHLKTTRRIVAIGASTGGTMAVETVLKGYPPSAPGTVVVQHMPPYFTSTFAERLDKICDVEVREAVDKDVVAPGLVLIAPGGKHMMLERSGALFVVRIKDGPLVHHQKPAVDVLFQSVARNAGANAVGVILTGMGADGAKGLLAMREAGASTFAQDEQTCVVFGMPRQAIALGAAERVLPLQDIAQWLLACAEHREAA
jgi:two-component system chemotaxis response regulator CheB